MSSKLNIKLKSATMKSKLGPEHGANEAKGLFNEQIAPNASKEQDPTPRRES